MGGQLSFASLDYAAKKKRTKREVFLAEMSRIVPWAKLAPTAALAGVAFAIARGAGASDRHCASCEKACTRRCGTP